MSITPEQYRDMERRLSKGKALPDAPSDAAQKEIEEIHLPIMRWCDRQIPAVPYYHARTDKPSGIAEGAADFCLFYRSRVFIVEAKSRTGKLSDKQRDWLHLCELQGFTTHTVRSFAEFLELVGEI